MAGQRVSLVSEVSVPGLPAPASHYADATIMGDQLFISGLLSLDESGALVGRDDVTAQAEHIFATMRRILNAVGSDLDDVAKLTFFVLDIAHRGAVNEVRKAIFTRHRPASTLVQVSGLIGNGTLLEVEAIAAVRHPTV